MNKDEQNEELFPGINSHKHGREDPSKVRPAHAELRSPHSEGSDVEGPDEPNFHDPEVLKKKLPSERVSLKREREMFLQALDFDPKKTLNDFTALRQMRPDPTYALLGRIPAERIKRMETWLDRRRPSVPKVVASGLLKSDDLRAVTIHSARFREAFNDSEKLTRMVIMCAEIIARLKAMRSEQLAYQDKIECAEVAEDAVESDTSPYDRVQIGREIIWIIDNHIAEYGSDLEMLQSRLNRARSEEERLFGAMHGWLIDIARTLEASGFDASSNRSVRRKVIREFMEILERYAESNPELRAKMDDPVGSYSLMKQVLEDRMTAEEVEAEGTIDDVAAVADHQTIPLDLGEVDKDVIENRNQPQTEPLAPAFDERALSLLAISGLAQRADGHGRIIGVANAQAANAGFASQSYGAATTFLPRQAELGDVFVRLDERIPYSLRGLRTDIDGKIDPLIWIKFEVPAGPYKLIQVNGPSSLLPRCTQYDMLPPVTNLEDAGKFLGITNEPAVQTLKAWGPVGEDPAHLRAHVLDGPHGDPAAAIEVCRKLVAMQRMRWKDAGHVTYIAMESIARWWLFLLAGRMRPGQIDLLWPDGFFHGVEGHDIITRDKGHYRLVRCDGGRIGSALKAD